MQIILLKSVDKLGRAGDVKEVAGGYFRNFLFPQGLAELATAGSLQKAKNMRVRVLRKEAEVREAFSQMLETLRQEPLIMPRKATGEGHLFGSVTEQDIISALSEKGYMLDERQIHLETHIKELGTYPVLLKFDETITGTISLSVERGPS